MTSVTVTVLDRGVPTSTRTYPGSPAEVLVDALPFRDTYSFTVSATNAFGPGATSAPSNVVSLYYG